MHFETWNNTPSQYVLVTRDKEYNRSPRLFDFDLEPSSSLKESYTPEQRLDVMNHLIQCFRGDDKAIYLHALSDSYLTNRAQSFNCMSLPDITDLYLLLHSTEDIDTEELDDLRSQLIQCLASPVIYQHSTSENEKVH